MWAGVERLYSVAHQDGIQQQHRALDYPSLEGGDSLKKQRMMMHTDCERWGSQDELPRMDQVGLKIADLGQSVGAHATASTASSLASPLHFRQLLDSSCGFSNMQGEQARGGAHGEDAGGGRGLVIGAGWGMSDVQRKRAFAQSQVGCNHDDARLNVYGSSCTPSDLCSLCSSTRFFAQGSDLFDPAHCLQRGMEHEAEPGAEKKSRFSSGPELPQLIRPSAFQPPAGSWFSSSRKQAGGVQSTDERDCSIHDQQQLDSTTSLSLSPYSSRTKSYSPPSWITRSFSLPPGTNEEISDCLSLQQSESAAAVQVPPKGITLDLTMSIGGQ